jgi:hypothetical protein
MTRTLRSAKLLLACLIALVMAAATDDAHAGIGGKKYCGGVLPEGGDPAPYCVTFNSDGTVSGEGLSGTWTEVDFGLFGFFSATTESDDGTIQWSGLHILGAYINAVGDFNDSAEPSLSFAGIVSP